MNLAFISHGNIKTRYHGNYDGLNLNDKVATLFTENILSALNTVGWTQNVNENSSFKSSSDSDHIRAKGNAFTSTKTKHPKMKIPFVTYLSAFRNSSKEQLTYF